MIKRLLIFVLIATTANFFTVLKANAASVTITATVPPASATFSGFAPASSVVSFKDNGVVAATTLTSVLGTFSQQVVSSPGVHDFALFLTDTAGRTTPETTFSGVTLINQTDTPISNVLLPPTITLSQSSIFNGQGVLVFGQGSPGSTVHVVVNGTERFTSSLSNSDWQFSLDKNYYHLGTNSIYAFLTRPSATNSVNSFTINLNVNNCRRSDLNCDGFVNLTDFSIELYYWGSNYAPADTNSDGTVGLIDFSIMMFDWTG